MTESDPAWPLNSGPADCDTQAVMNSSGPSSSAKPAQRDAAGTITSWAVRNLDVGAGVTRS
jgi:hypothetical protein